MLHGFYPIVPDANWVARLVPLGVKTIQLRIKDVSTAQIRQEIIESLKVCRQNSCQLIVNDYWQQAIDLGADYIHLGQEDLAAADLVAIKQAGLSFGLSTHSHEELDIALAARPNYVALGPIYETKLKKMKWAPQGLKRITEWKSKVPVPLIAIGGLTVENAKGALTAGADAIAVVTDIVTHPTPEKRTRKWLTTI